MLDAAPLRQLWASCSQLRDDGSSLRFALTDAFSMFAVNKAILADVNGKRKQPKCGVGAVAQQARPGAAPPSVRSPGFCSPPPWISNLKATVTTSGSHLLLQSLQ